MNKNDIIIICGDFGGIWNDTPEERYWLDWLNDKPFSTLFVDGNHENFDRLKHGFQIVNYCGGKAHRIRSSIFHLMRGEVYKIQGKKFFAFGGASSHDIRDGIVDPAAFDDDKALKRELQWRQITGQQFRVRGVSWWPDELPNDEEMQCGLKNLAKHDYKVDYVITHCLPQEIASVFSMGLYEPDTLTRYLNTLLHYGLKFDRWFCGHYHAEHRVMGKFEIMYESIKRIV